MIACSGLGACIVALLSAGKTQSRSIDRSGVQGPNRRKWLYQGDQIDGAFALDVESLHQQVQLGGHDGQAAVVPGKSECLFWKAADALIELTREIEERGKESASHCGGTWRAEESRGEHGRHGAAERGGTWGAWET